MFLQVRAQIMFEPALLREPTLRRGELRAEDSSRTQRSSILRPHEYAVGVLAGGFLLVVFLLVLALFVGSRFGVIVGACFGDVRRACRLNNIPSSIYKHITPQPGTDIGAGAG